jgi:hypothetical protein
MYVEAELVLSAYKPRKLKQGMLFLNRRKDPPEMTELDHEVADKDPYIMIFGHPVELGLFDLTLTYQLAKHEEIAWVDEGEDSEDMHEITIEDINSILRSNNHCKIQIKDKLYQKERMIIPVYDEEKVIIKLIEEEE